VSALSFSVPQLPAKFGGMALVMLGAGWVVYAALAGDTVLTRYYRQYTAHIDRSLRLLFMTGSGARIAQIQICAAILTTGVGATFDLPFWYVVLAGILFLPVQQLARKRAEHIKRLEAQLDTLILSLANSLKTVPSPAAALQAIVPILPMPMRLEIDRLLREMRIGSTLEQALLNMSARLKSPDLDNALSAVLIGLQVGGNLPVVLENTAATIREMNRLEGVVRTKTSEARAQLWVLALFPFVICFAFTMLDPQYFTPLQLTFVGNLITAVALILWLGSLLTARKILKVDL
jgi:tight adherence protein B